jgi:undecaprenyl-diphosphatase
MEVLAQLDRSLFLFLNSFHLTFLNPIMVILSGQAIWIPFIGFFLWQAKQKFNQRNFWLFVLFLICALVASDASSSYIFKNIFDRLRPCREVDLKPLIYSFGQKCGGKYSFVSSHASNSLVLIAYSVRALNINVRWMIPFGLMVALVSFSRIYLGVHYPGDVLGGWVVGLVWGLFFSFVFRTQGASR